MRNFLLGVLAGVLLLGATLKTVDVYRDINARLSFVEGYIGALDQYLRGTTQDPTTRAGRRTMH